MNILIELEYYLLNDFHSHMGNIQDFAIRYFTELFIRASILSKSNFEFSYNALKIKILTILSLTVCGHHDKSRKVRIYCIIINP